MASNGFSYELEIDASRVEDMLNAAGESFPRYRKQWIGTAANRVRDEAERLAPVGVAGLSGQGISHNISIVYDGDYTTAMIGPNSNVSSYAEAVEKGSGPHRPPVFPGSSLWQWAELKGISPYAVAQSIAKNGTQAHPYMEPALENTRDGVISDFNEGVTAYLARYA